MLGKPYNTKAVSSIIKLKGTSENLKQIALLVPDLVPDSPRTPIFLKIIPCRGTPLICSNFPNSQVIRNKANSGEIIIRLRFISAIFVDSSREGTQHKLPVHLFEMNFCLKVDHSSLFNLDYTSVRAIKIYNNCCERCESQSQRNYSN